MVELFKEIGLDPSLLKALEREHITVPTDIQRQAIPEVLKGRDLIVQSETGTGKTLAYLLPLFEKINTEAREMQALILTPTHELAIQVQHVIEGLVRFSDVRVTSAPMIGNVNIDRQIDRLKQKPHIIVGTPGRVLELIKKKKIASHTIRTIVLDEADRLMGDSDIDDVRAVIKSTLRDRQLLMFSASVSKEAEARGRELMNEPEVIRGEPGISVPDTIEHLFFMAEQREKFEVLRKVLRILNPQKAVVFASGIEEAELVTEKLKYHGFRVESLHGTNRKDERKKALEGFRAGKLQLLVASDIASRGLDIEEITHIFSLNAPEDPRDYLHRVGRTGRNGRTGVAVSIITDRELQLIRHFEKVLNITISAKAMYKGNIIDAKAPAQRAKPAVRAGASNGRPGAERPAKPASAKAEGTVKGPKAERPAKRPSAGPGRPSTGPAKRLPAGPGRPKFRPKVGKAPKKG